MNLTTLFIHVTQRFGIPEKEAQRFFKFAVVGVIGAIVDFGTFNLLRILLLRGLQPEASTTWAVTTAAIISFIAAICSNFLWNRYWTYPDSRSKAIHKQFIQFTMVSIAGVVIRAPLVGLTHHYLTNLLLSLIPTLDEGVAIVLGDNLALVLAVFTVMFWNFFVNRYWTYGDVK